MLLPPILLLTRIILVCVCSCAEIVTRADGVLIAAMEVGDGYRKRGGREHVSSYWTPIRRLVELGLKVKQK
jgi:hypothetical protein